jgi:hypothetical protein
MACTYTPHTGITLPFGKYKDRPIHAPGRPPRPVERCPRCPSSVGVDFRWQADSWGRRHVRSECAGCGKFLGFVPRTAPYTTLADEAQGVTR